MKIVFAALTLCLFICTSCCTQSQEEDKKFISLAYVALGQLGLHNVSPDEVAPLLDKYNWNGITDIVAISGLFIAGSDGSIVTSWNKEQWPPMYEGVDYLGNPITEQYDRDILCSKEVLREMFNYFQEKGIDTWVSQIALGWLQGGSLGTVCKSSELTKKYAKNVYDFAQEFGCIGVDLDWEFPPTEREAEGYREFMRELKRLGTRVSVCAITPTIGNKTYTDMPIPVEFDPEAINNHEGRYMKWEEIIDQEMVDQINVMQYFGYNPETKQMDFEIKKEKMKIWEDCFPREFTEDRKVDILSGIGYFSYMIPKADGIERQTTYNVPQIYEKFGEEALDDRVVGGHTLWVTDDIRDMVRYAKSQGWSGVFTWLVSHDLTLDMPQEYSRQQALAEEMEKIWSEQQ